MSIWKIETFGVTEGRFELPEPSGEQLLHRVLRPTRARRDFPDFEPFYLGEQDHFTILRGQTAYGVLESVESFVSLHPLGGGWFVCDEVVRHGCLWPAMLLRGVKNHMLGDPEQPTLERLLVLPLEIFERAERP